jgi:hypothetical protein
MIYSVVKLVDVMYWSIAMLQGFMARSRYGLGA